jgi:Glycine zipper 2TM domain
LPNATTGDEQLCDEPFNRCRRFRIASPCCFSQLQQDYVKEDNMRKLILTLSAITAIAPALIVPAAPAVAHGRYSQAREWQGNDGRYYCRRRDGTVGLIVGGAGGALLGRAVDTRGSRAGGTIIGAAAGALLGREIARKRSCR